MGQQGQPGHGAAQRDAEKVMMDALFESAERDQTRNAAHINANINANKQGEKATW